MIAAMAGGLFDGKPFSVNLKCVLATLAIALGYWTLPAHGTAEYAALYGVVGAGAVYGYDRFYHCAAAPRGAGLIVLFVAIAVAIAVVVMFAPRHNFWVLAVTLYLPYLALAWWDYVFDCDTRMDPTIFPFGRYIYLPFKPVDYQMRWSALPLAKKEYIARADVWFGWLAFAAAVTLGVGYFGSEVSKQKSHHK